MRGGLAGWIALVLILLPFAACGAGVSLFIDGEPAEFSSPIIVSEGTLYAPLAEFAPRLGAEAVRTPDGDAVKLRWDGGRGEFPSSRFPSFAGDLYVSVDWLVSLLGGAVHRIGEERHVETDVRMLVDLEATGEEVVLRFDGFVPQEIIAQDERTIRVRFFHCLMQISPRSIILAEGTMTRVEIASVEPEGCELTITLRAGGVLRVRRVAGVGFHSVSLRIGDEPYFETVTELSDRFTVHEVRTVLSGGEADIAYLTIDDWRRGYRLRPGISTGGVGEPCAISEIASACGATAAIAAGSSLDLFVLSGLPYSLDSGSGGALGFDLFGRISVFPSSVSIVFHCDGERIPIDGVNRPISYGEAIVYSPGYTGEIARGIPGLFTVIKLRDGRVVSVYDGSFVSADPGAAFVVASGEARARFSSVFLGDRSEIQTYRLDDRSQVVDAIGIVGVLFQDGDDLSASLKEGLEEDFDRPMAWSIVCTDWYGGLILLSIARDGASAGATLSDVSSSLRSLPVPVKDAFVLNVGRSGGLIYSDSGSYEHLVDGEWVTTALCLVPIER